MKSPPSPSPAHPQGPNSPYHHAAGRASAYECGGHNPVLSTAVGVGKGEKPTEACGGELVGAGNGADPAGTLQRAVQNGKWGGRPQTPPSLIPGGGASVRYARRESPGQRQRDAGPGGKADSEPRTALTSEVGQRGGHRQPLLPETLRDRRRACPALAQQVQSDHGFAVPQTGRRLPLGVSGNRLPLRCGAGVDRAP